MGLTLFVWHVRTYALVYTYMFVYYVCTRRDYRLEFMYMLAYVQYIMYCMYVHVCTYVCVCVYVGTYVCMYMRTNEWHYCSKIEEWH